MLFHQRQQTVQEFAKWIKCTDYSHTEPAGHADSARTAIVSFESKFARDNFLAAVRKHGLQAWGLSIQVRPQ
eukprot:10450171-Alexandrium_andersonii.AAC.1